MTYTIHKQRLVVTDMQSLSLPLDAEILSAQVQHGEVCLWYRFDASKVVTRTVQIAIVGTGHPCPEPSEARFIGTVMLHDGSLVFRVFERLYQVRS